MMALDALLSRVSVGALREPAPAGEALDLVLRSGLCAPDHGRLRPWRFVLIRGVARDAFAETAVAALLARDPDTPPVRIDRLRARLTGTPLIVALGVRVRTGHAIPEIEQMLSVGAAAMNMLNALHALGYGGVWVTGPNSYDPRVVAALGLDAEDRLAGFLFVGTPIEAPRIAARPALSDHVMEWTGDATRSMRDDRVPA